MFKLWWFVLLITFVIMVDKPSIEGLACLGFAYIGFIADYFYKLLKKHLDKAE